jgi:hypothetical protein
VKNPAEIEFLLNEHNIPSLNEKHKDIFHRLPKPGDVVDIRWHTILDNAFIAFEVDEYVAYLSGSNEKGDVEYRYAIVKEKLSSAASADSPFSQAYLVQTTVHEEKKMKAHKLYRFNRSKISGEQNTFRDFQVQVLHISGANTESNSPLRDDKTLKTIFKEIRDRLKDAFTLSEKERKEICLRSMHEWYPNKNLDDVERATEVFQYIKTIMQKLEDGENVDVEEKTEQPNRPHPWSDSVFKEFETLIQREQEYHRRYRRPSNPSSRHHQHSDNTYHRNPQPYEAARWLDESKYDICFAWQSKSSEKNFHSWICFISHQVSDFSNVCISSVL